MYVRTDMKSGAACYTVQSGDNLSQIANRFYGSMSASDVQKIYYSNVATIGPNMNLIYPGRNCISPTKSSGDGVVWRLPSIANAKPLQRSKSMQKSQYVPQFQVRTHVHSATVVT